MSSLAELGTRMADAVIEEQVKTRVEAMADRMDTSHVVVCLSGLSAHANGSPIFGCLVYGPFRADEVEEKAREIRSLEGGAVLVRPLVDLAETYRRISAD